jgi:hypothetical protein
MALDQSPCLNSSTRSALAGTWSHCHLAGVPAVSFLSLHIRGFRPAPSAVKGAFTA